MVPPPGLARVVTPGVAAAIAAVHNKPAPRIPRHACFAIGAPQLSRRDTMAQAPRPVETGMTAAGFKTRSSAQQLALHLPAPQGHSRRRGARSLKQCRLAASGRGYVDLLFAIRDVDVQLPQHIYADDDRTVIG